MASKQGRRRLFAEEPTDHNQKQTRVTRRERNWGITNLPESRIFGTTGVELLGEPPVDCIYNQKRRTPTEKAKDGNHEKISPREWMTIYCCDQEYFNAVKEWLPQYLKDIRGKDQKDEEAETIEGPTYISLKMKVEDIDRIMKQEQPIVLDIEDKPIGVFIARGRAHEFHREDCPPISPVDPSWTWTNSQFVGLLIFWGLLVLITLKCL